MRVKGKLVGPGQTWPRRQGKLVRVLAAVSCTLTPKDSLRSTRDVRIWLSEPMTAQFIISSLQRLSHGRICVYRHHWVVRDAPIVTGLLKVH